MKQDSAIVRFFAVPELLHLLGQHLPIRELTRLVCTNRANNAAFTPFLWQTIPREMARRVSLSPALTNKIHLIQSLDLSAADINTVRSIYNALENSVQLRYYRQAVLAGIVGSHTRFGLHHLSFVVDSSASLSSLKLPRVIWSKKTNEQLILLFQQTPFLTDLTIPADMLEYEARYLNSFLNAITFSLPRLEKFVMETVGDHYVPLTASVVLVERCMGLPNLIKLDCKFEARQSEEYIIGSEEWESLFDQTLDLLQRRPPHRRSDKLKFLRLPCTIYPIDFLVPFFRDCVPDLEELSVPFFDDILDGTRWKAEDLRKAVRSSCPSMKKVTAPLYTQKYPDADFITLPVKTILEGCSSKDGVNGGAGLRSLVLTDGNLDWIQIGSALEPHLMTLQELTSFIGGQRFAGLGLLVQCCKNLKVLNMNWHNSKPGGYPLEWWPDRWICQGLRKLCVQMEEPAHHLCPPPPKVARHKSWEHVVRFYKAIGRLEELEELTLGYGTPGIRTNISLTDLMLTAGKVEGCLGYLTRWRKLKHLRLMHDFWSRMGEPEMEFIAEHWPQLKEITFRTNNTEWLRTYMKDMYCWRKLKRLLPDLEYTFLHSGSGPGNYTEYN
ncbi:hypothetical protein EMPS_07307 [Entomortierella parvispora]|uniref:Uncharacterized protein n=1 Tax=Entomortierella parvispora TaxID=205924 RepID=A0A9P3LY86_9FUNG|nr:hypothetical protein EMPS_07307 [Entomortierella parvispora]